MSEKEDEGSRLGKSATPNYYSATKLKNLSPVIDAEKVNELLKRQDDAYDSDDDDDVIDAEQYQRDRKEIEQLKEKYARMRLPT